MAAVPSGHYAIQNQIGVLCAEYARPGSKVYVGQPNTAEVPIWRTIDTTDGTMVIIRTRSGLDELYLGYPADPQPGSSLVVASRPALWELRSGIDDAHLLVAVPAAQTSDNNDGLVVGIGRARSGVLATYDPKDDNQSWSFKTWTL